MKHDDSGTTIRRLEAHRRRLLATVSVMLAPDALPGSLASSRYRCGKPTCHCADGDGHLRWTLTYMLDGRKQTQHVPHDEVDVVRQRVEQGNDFKKAVAELMATNAQLLLLERRERRARKKAVVKMSSR
jgi:hypothetical protein